MITGIRFQGSGIRKSACGASASVGILTILLALTFSMGCEQAVPVDLASYENFGETISWEGALPIADVLDTPSEYVGKAVKIEGVARKVCQKKGCWMTVDAAPHGSIRVTFKDYAFFVPMDISGKTVIVEGIIDEANMSEEEREHYEKEEGLSAEDANEVIEAGRNMAIVASGVIVKTENESSLQSTVYSPQEEIGQDIGSNELAVQDQRPRTNDRTTN